MFPVYGGRIDRFDVSRPLRDVCECYVSKGIPIFHFIDKKWPFFFLWLKVIKRMWLKKYKEYRPYSN